jgi:peptide-methionine (S)-S-oxide reductase
METIVFAGGCFWCTEAVFAQLAGVISVEPGYTGGAVPNPSYEAVCSGTTGHAEAIQIVYNPAQVRVEDLLTVFFATHDPTQLNRQGNDVGTQYRSAVFYTTDAQRQAAEKIIAEIEASSHEGGHVVTEVKPLDVFYPAEEYHRDYFARNPAQAYCQLVINPKVAKVQEKFAELLKQK